MGIEVDLLENYPKPHRDTSKRANEKNDEIRKIARKFDFEFFDSDRKYGYGGFNYNEKFWGPVIPTFKNYWNLKSSSSILDVGCAKGFMIYDFIKQIPGIDIKGIDISEYAITNCKKEVKENVSVGNAKSLVFKDNSFDYITKLGLICEALEMLKMFR